MQVGSRQHRKVATHQGAIDKDVAEEHRAEQQITAPAQRQNGSGVLCFLRRTGAGHNLGDLGKGVCVFMLGDREGDQKADRSLSETQSKTQQGQSRITSSSLGSSDIKPRLRPEKRPERHNKITMRRICALKKNGVVVVGACLGDGTQVTRAFTAPRPAEAPALSPKRPGE